MLYSGRHGDLLFSAISKSVESVKKDLWICAYLGELIKTRGC